MTISNISTTSMLSNTYQSPDWYENLWQASRKGNLHEVKLVALSHILTSSPGEFAQCFIVAAREGHKDIIEFFISLNMLKKISQKDLVYALDPAGTLGNNRKEIIDAIIDSIQKNKDPTYLYKTFKAALANDRIQAVKAIIKLIDPKYVREALRSILIKNSIESEGFTTNKYYTDHLEIIINSLTPEHLHKAFSGLAWANHQKDITYLEIHMNSLSAECLCKILHAFLGQENCKEIEDVVNSKRILHPDRYGKAFIQAVLNCNEDIIQQFFINSSQFNVLELTYLDQALKTSNAKIKQIIIDREAHNWYRNLCQASREGNLDKITSIIEQLNIKIENFPDELTGCFIAAAEKGHKDIIDFFISLNALKIITLKDLVHGLNSGLEQNPKLESCKEIVKGVIDSILLDKNTSILPQFRLGEVFKAALAHNCIKVTEAITRSVDSLYLYDGLKSMLNNKPIESEGDTIYGDYKDLIKAVINSLTPELSWEIVGIDAGIVNAGSADNSKEVVEAVTRSMDPLFLNNALKSCIEKKHSAKSLSALGYYENLIRITISSLKPKPLCQILLVPAHNEVIKTIINFISSEHLCQILHLSLEQNYDFIKIIIESTRILYPDNYGRAFVQAVQNYQIGVVQLFINSNRFITLKLEYLDQALETSYGKISQMIRNSDRVKNLNITEF